MVQLSALLSAPQQIFDYMIGRRPVVQAPVVAAALAACHQDVFSPTLADSQHGFELVNQAPASSHSTPFALFGDSQRNIMFTSRTKEGAANNAIVTFDNGVPDQMFSHNDLNAVGSHWNGVHFLDAETDAILMIQTERDALGNVTSHLVFNEDLQLDDPHLLPLGGRLLSGLALSQEGSKVYVGLSDMGQHYAGQAYFQIYDTAVIRSRGTADDAIDSTTQLMGDNATGVAALSDQRALVLTSGTELQLGTALHIIDHETGAVLRRIPVTGQDGPDESYEVMGQLSSQLTVSEDGRFAYIGTADEFSLRKGEFFKVDLATGEVTQRNLNDELKQKLGWVRAKGGFHTAVKIAGDYIMVGDFNNKVVMALDKSTLELVGVYETGTYVGAISVNTQAQDLAEMISVTGEGQTIDLAFRAV